jgi:type I restriction-modification system DNA methylase subunit
MSINKGYLTAKTNKESDEYYTPKEAVIPIIKYLRREMVVWCPFDTEDSEYVKCIQANGNKVIFSHIDNGENFFSFEPKERYDVIISNPPFSLKDDILKRLDELNKPFAILLPLPTLQGQKRFEYLKNCEALIFDKRINFYNDKEHKIMVKGVAFASIYICKNFLPEKLIFEKL